VADGSGTRTTFQGGQITVTAGGVATVSYVP
jgi:hypothetical protein